MDQHISSGQSRNQNVRVFINYAHEDSQGAQRLYKDLKNIGLDPWLDTESILPGQNWETAIHEAIMKSRYFIPLFSTMSVGKRGIYLKEFKFAVEELQKFPAGEIFAIPARLDNCEIPYEELRSIDRIDLFPSWNDGLQKILEATGIKNRKLGNETSLNTINDEWHALLTAIYEKRCISFIGTEGHTPWIPRDLDIARKWAEEYNYPLEVDELSKVSLYLAIDKEDATLPKNASEQTYQRHTTTKYYFRRIQIYSLWSSCQSRLIYIHYHQL